MSYQYLIIYVILIVISCLGLKINRTKDRSDFIEESHKNANYLRGIFAIIIVLGHTTLIFDKVPIVLMPLNKISTLCVGYFFAMSGYGLAYSFKNKKNYLSHFLAYKLLNLVIVACIVIIFNYVVQFLFKFIAKEDFQIATTNWYIYELAFCYFIFYISYKLFKGKKKAIIVLIIIALASIIAMIIKLPRVYYISELAFPIGILCFEYKDKINEFINKRFILTLLSIILIGIISIFAFFVEEYTILDWLLHNLLFIPFYFILLLLCNYIKIENKIIKFLNRISLELYLYQFVVMNIISKIMQMYNLNRGLGYIFTVLVVDIVLAFCMSKCNNISKQKLKKLTKKEITV